MPILHCDACHHELEGPEGRTCDWCGAGTHVLVRRSELERMVAPVHFLEADLGA
jgi:hypothetical protein